MEYPGRFLLLNMGMVVNVILAIAMIAATAGAITEFQLRVCNISTTADGTLVGVVLRLGGGALLVGEGDGAGVLFRSALPDSTVLVSASGPPGGRQQIQRILSGENNEVCDADQREQIVGEQVAFCIKAGGNIHKHNHVNDRQDPGFNRYNKENQEMRIRVDCGI